jgi:hypothetical protein
MPSERNLKTLEAKFDALNQSINFQPILQAQIARGKVLIAIKEQCLIERVGWYDWLREKGIKERTAQVWMQIATDHIAQPPTTAVKHLTGEQYLQKMRNAKTKAKRRQLDDHRKELAARAPFVRVDQRYQLHHADCQKFSWPQPIDLIATDPPWADVACYQWLGKFAKTHLKSGGLLLCQSYQHGMDKHLTALAQAGLTYCWTLALVYAWKQMAERRLCAFIPAWRPVLVFSNGKMKLRGGACCDTHTVRADVNRFHEWQQPLAPWQQWLHGLTVPGQLIADPFSGSATFGIAVKSLGGRRFIGTEIGEENWQVAKVRLSEAKEGDYKPKG